jgi:hypothetical protein
MSTVPRPAWRTVRPGEAVNYRPARGDKEPHRPLDLRGDPCRNPSCDRKITSLWCFSGLCRTCEAAQRRWGDFNQKPVPMTELKPYLRAAKAARKRNPEADFGAVYEAWTALVERCQTEEVVAPPRETAHSRSATRASHERQARGLVVAIGANASPETLLDLAIAIHMVKALNPARYLTEECFRLSLVHAFRRAGKAGKATTRPDPYGRTHEYYRDFAAETRLVLADLILEAFGPVASRLAEIERERVTAKATRQARYAETVAALC